MEDSKKFEEWAVVEVMGHQRFIGKVSEQVIAGTGFVRIDIPATDSNGPWTKLVGTSSIYAITPVSEELAREMASEARQQAISRYELPSKLIEGDTF